MDENIIKLLKNYLEKREYEKYNDILEKEIISIFVKKIQMHNDNFLYSNKVELLEFAEIYLDEYESEICRKFYNISKSGYESEILSEILMNIYEKIKLGE